MKIHLAISTLLATATWLTHGSFFGSHSPLHHNHDHGVVKRDNFCGGPHSLPCPNSEPCCNNGTCHTTSMQACPIALGCDEKHSAPDACFPLPGCSNLKDNFKHANLVIPKYAFTGDPNQAHWTSDFHHIAPYAKVDQKHHKLQLRVRRDMVKTRSGGGFGARVSSTRWAKYGSFSVKLKSASTGPGIVTAVLLSNPAIGDEISFELTGRDPKTVYTNYYHRLPMSKKQGEDNEHDHHEGEEHHKDEQEHASQGKGHGHTDHATRGQKGHNQQQEQQNHKQPDRVALGPLTPHEEAHTLKKDATTHFLTYKIEWNEKMIRWSVDGKTLRTLHVEKVTDTYTNIPSNAMQLQIMVWDAGYAPETSEWSGGKTDYGADNLDEYIATIESVDIHCHDSKEGNKPWPGPEAKKRLHAAEQQAKVEAKRAQEREAEAERDRKRRMGLYPERHATVLEALFRPIVRFFDVAVLTLIKWTFVLLAIVCAAAYITEPQHQHRRNYKATMASKPVVVQ